MKDLRSRFLIGRRLLVLGLVLLGVCFPRVALGIVPWDEPLEGPRLIQNWLLAAIPETGNAHGLGLQEDHLLKWLGLPEHEFATVEKGPSAGDALTGDPAFDWRAVETEGMVDIDAFIQPEVNNEHSTAYLFVYITADSEREMRMWVGSDDSIAVWVNGVEVHRKAILRSLALDQDNFVVHLRQGKNALMLKVTEQTGRWGAVARFEHTNGLLFATDKNVEGQKLPPAPRYIRNWLILVLPNPAPGTAAIAAKTDLIYKHDGHLTEANIARHGVLEGDHVGQATWMQASLANLESNNINDMVNRSLGWVGDHNNLTLYAFCTVYSPDNRITDMRVGSDDSIVVWVGGQEVWRFAGARGLTLDEDRFPVRLRKGRNYLLVKVAEQSGGWAMTVRFEDDEDLRYSVDRDFRTVTPSEKWLTTWGSIRSNH